MGFYNDRILPHLMSATMNSDEIHETRSRVLAGLTGDVVEIGFGSGLNVPHYPAEVTSIRIVEPSRRSIELGAERIAESPATIRQIGSDAQRLELDDASVETVVSTWSLCTIPDADLALAEIVRVLVPGGLFRFVEHGPSPNWKVNRWQHRVEPVWKRLAGGCHLVRPIDELIARSGLGITDMRSYDHPKDPRVASWTFEGSARKM
jgi:ubiquinone/menaquinone biosynthesis C-methylase UbiE